MNPHELPLVRVDGAPGYSMFEARFFMDFEQNGRCLNILMIQWSGKWDHVIIDSRYVIHIKEEK